MVVPLSGQALIAARVFAFGKLPAHGDFVSRGLSPAERDAWDAWASESLAAARDSLGDAAFAERHDAAAPWRFTFGPGDFGPGWRAGALTPSIDRTGRRYIIVAGAEVAAPLAPDGAGARIASAMEEAIYSVFGSGGDIDALVREAQARLTRIEPTAAGVESATVDAAAEGRFWTAEAEQSIVSRQPPADLLVRALATA